MHVGQTSSCGTVSCSKVLLSHCFFWLFPDGTWLTDLDGVSPGPFFLRYPKKAETRCGQIDGIYTRGGDKGETSLAMLLQKHLRGQRPMDGG